MVYEHGPSVVFHSPLGCIKIRNPLALGVDFSFLSRGVCLSYTAGSRLDRGHNKGRDGVV